MPINCAYRTTSHRQSSGVLETVSVVDTINKAGLRMADGMRNVNPPLEAGK